MRLNVVFKAMGPVLRRMDAPSLGGPEAKAGEAGRGDDAAVAGADDELTEGLRIVRSRRAKRFDEVASTLAISAGAFTTPMTKGRSVGGTPASATATARRLRASELATPMSERRLRDRYSRMGDVGSTPSVRGAMGGPSASGVGAVTPVDQAQARADRRQRVEALMREREERRSARKGERPPP